MYFVFLFLIVKIFKISQACVITTNFYWKLIINLIKNIIKNIKMSQDGDDDDVEAILARINANFDDGEIN